MKIRQILESVSVGGMGTSSVATAPAKAGKMQRRKGNLFAAEGAEFGAYYSEQVAQQIFNKRQDITSEDEVLNQAYHIVANEQGQKTARYKFNYDEDFPSDVVSSYFWLQRNKGVAEAMTPQQQHDFDRMRAGAMSRQAYDAKWKKPRKSDDEVIYGKRKGVAEGASDYVGNAIEDLRASKPGLDRESFLDELYFYIDAQYGKQAADAAFAREDDATFDEWYDSYTDMMEVSMGDYRKKAAMQKAQSQMGAMFARDPAEREKNLATFNKREKGLNRLKARDEKARKAEQDKQLADLVARLPELKAEYERMRAEYKSLGGSDWQYADREQNLSDYERKARSMEGPMNNLWRQIQAAEKAKGLAEEISRRGFLKGLAGVAGGIGVVGAANQIRKTQNLDAENVTTVNGEKYTLGRPSLGANLDGKTSSGKYKLVKDDKGNIVYIWNDVRTAGGPTRFVKKYIPVDQLQEQGVAEYGDTAKGQKMLAKVHHRAADRVTSKKSDTDPAYARKAQQTQDRAWDRMTDKDLEENKKGVRAVKHTTKPRNPVAKNASAAIGGGAAGAHKDKKKAAKQGEVKHKGKELAYESKLWAALERKISK